MAPLTDAAEKVVHGDITRFFAGDPTAGILGGAYLFKMGGLPAAAIAMWHCAKPENRRRIGGIMVSAALTSFLTGITEPIEFSFMFVAPVLYGVHALLAGFSQILFSLLGAKLGFTFSQGFIDFVLYYAKDTKPWLVLVVGPTGHGKTTTLAAMVDYINRTRTDHVITIEDPIEYLFTSDRAIVDQREVGVDTKGFHQALRSMFREDVDVAMIGEMRDADTIGAAVTAAETGHLILSSLHTNNAAQTIDRIIDSFPGHQQGQIRQQLAATLVAIVSQRLIPRISGGLIPAVEVLIGTPAVRTLVREGKVHELDLVIETNSDLGMQSLNRSLVDLVRRGEIAMDQAAAYSLNPDELSVLLRG